MSIDLAFAPRLLRTGMVALGLMAAAILGLAPGFDATAARAQSAEASSLSDAQAEEVEGLIREYILNNPEVILEAFQRLEAKREAQQKARAQAALSQSSDAIFNNPMDPVHGPEDATVTLVEFFDYQCGYCKRVFPSIMKLADSQPDLRIVFKEFPILGPASEIAAKAAHAAERQGGYMAFHEALMAMRGELTEARIYETAGAVGLDVDQLKSDMQAPEIAAYIQETRALAESLGVNGTPAFVIGDQLIPGAISYDQLVQLVEAKRAEDG